MPAPHAFVTELLGLLPEFTSRWNLHLQEWNDGSDRGNYNDLAVFALGVTEEAGLGNTRPARVAFGFIADHLAQRHPEAEGLLVWGLLEDIQTIATHTPNLSNTLRAELPAGLAIEWEKIAAVWAGEGSLADVIRRERSLGDGHD